MRTKSSLFNRFQISSFRSKVSAFTMIELLVAMAVLALLIVMVAQLTNGTTTVTTSSTKRLDADSQARLIFDRMANDFGRMVKRKDVDCIFYKNAISGTSAINDAMFFYSDAPSYSAGFNTSAPISVSLVGYRVHLNLDPTDATNTNTLPQLERLGEALSWDGITTNDAQVSPTPKTNTAPGGMVFLTYPSATPDPLSTLAGNWSKTVGTAVGNYADGTDPNYHVIGDQVYRMEINFLLTDGTISNKPVLSVTPATWSGSSTFFKSIASAPTVSSDSSNYAVGSRWYDTSASQGYICTSAATGAAVWNRIGVQDVSAIIVGLAFLDTNSRKLVTNSATGYSANLTGFLTDSVDTVNLANSPPNYGTTIAKTWGSLNYSVATSYTGVPQTAASQIRLYQRYFYLNQN